MAERSWCANLAKWGAGRGRRARRAGEAPLAGLPPIGPIRPTQHPRLGRAGDSTRTPGLSRMPCMTVLRLVRGTQSATGANGDSCVRRRPDRRQPGPIGPVRAGDDRGTLPASPKAVCGTARGRSTRRRSLPAPRSSAAVRARPHRPDQTGEEATRAREAARRAAQSTRRAGVPSP
jgi:hypothetical protein